MRIKSIRGQWVLLLLLFMFVSLIFSSGCREPTNDSPSYIPLTGDWVGTLDSGDSLLVDLVEVSSDSIIGDIVLMSNRNYTYIDTLKINYGRMMSNDSLTIFATSEAVALGLNSSIIQNAIMRGDYVLKIAPSLPDEGKWSAKRVE